MTSHIGKLGQHLLENRRPEDYIDVLGILITAYVKTEEFCNLPMDERQRVVDCNKEMIDFMMALVQLINDESFEGADRLKENEAINSYGSLPEIMASYIVSHRNRGTT